jgi:hypothetical protein
VNQMDKYLTPKSKGKHIGLELEIISKSNREQLRIAFRKARLSKYIQLGSDGSIRNTEEYLNTHEVRCLIPQRAYKVIVPRICKVLEECGSTANDSCGLHVHLDMRRKATKRNVKTAYQKLVDSLPKLQKMVKVHRYEGTPYKPPNRINNFDWAINGKPVKMQRQAYTLNGRPRTKNKQPVMEEYEIRSETERRNTAINPHAYQEHKTLEVRMKEGTVDNKEIIKWVDELVTIVDSKEVA